MVTPFKLMLPLAEVETKLGSVSDRMTLGSALAVTPVRSDFLLMAAAIAIALAALALAVVAIDAVSSVVLAALIAMSLITRVSPLKTPTPPADGDIPAA